MRSLDEAMRWIEYQLFGEVEYVDRALARYPARINEPDVSRKEKS